jgi:hypothetical protein
MECTEEMFLKDIASHEMHVLREDGVYRHVRFKRQGTMCYHFDLITWPGYLCYTGDMGTYVFSRLTDMFEFFRMDKRDFNYYPDRQLQINLSYWSEKLEAVSGTRHHARAKEFDKDEFRRVINEYRVSWIKHEARYDGLNKEERRELWEAVEDEVLSRIDDGEHACQQAAYDFYYRNDTTGEAFCFQDIFDHDFTKYTHQFIWCCYALAWGISKYDTERAIAA